MVRGIADALARTQLVDPARGARVQGETERLRAALLSSVSHDLRSPLATIIGSAESLAATDSFPPTTRRALAENILLEGQRLDRYIQNLLDMTRLGHGSLAIEREWVGVGRDLRRGAAPAAQAVPGAWRCDRACRPTCRCCMCIRR